MFKTLKDVAIYTSERISLDEVTLNNYITTDNLLPNKEGRTNADKLPPQSGNVANYQPDDILVSNIRPYLKKIWFSDIEGGSSSDVLAFKIIGNNNPRFVYYCLFRDEFFEHMMNGSKGTKMPRGDKTKILEYPIPDIERDEQDAIAEVLSSLDHKISLNLKINKKLEDISSLIFQRWFIDFDFPNENGQPYKSSGGEMEYNHEIQKDIPKGWTVDNCSKLLSFNPRMSLSKGVEASYLEMASIPTQGFMTKMPVRKGFAGGMKFRNDDVVFARITPCLENGKTALITLLEDDEVGFGSTEFIVFRGKEMNLRCFASCLARTKMFREFAISKMTGTSGRKRVKHTDIEGFKLAYPKDLKTLISFENLISSYFDKMTKNTQENAELSNLRDWLLPMLMNGQVRVNS